MEPKPKKNCRVRMLLTVLIVGLHGISPTLAATIGGNDGPIGRGYTRDQAMNDMKKQQQLQQQVLARKEQVERERQARLCPTALTTPLASAESEKSAYGLVLGAPLPCINLCADEPRNSTALMCRGGEDLFDIAGEILGETTFPPREKVKIAAHKAGTTTPWGTQELEITLNPNKLAYRLSRSPILETRDGVLVGVRFHYIPSNANSERATTDILSEKYKTCRRDNNWGVEYVWNCPSVIVRYKVADQRVTIYASEVEQLVARYLVEKAIREKKPGL